MARMNINPISFFEDDAYPLDKNQQLASRISVAAYEAGLDVETALVGEKVRVTLTAEKITQGLVAMLFTIIDEEFKKLPHEDVTRH